MHGSSSCLSYLCVMSIIDYRLLRTAMDDDYRLLLSDISNGTHHSNYSTFLKSDFDSLSTSDGLVLLDSCCIVLPLGAVKPILQLLHASHSGINKTLVLARSLILLARNGERHQTTYFPLLCLCSCAIIPTLHSYGHISTFHTPRISHATCGLGPLFFW